ncbi:hypothetical protein F9L33_14710 [Amylibacter sp. SFDW26]|uniref:alginate O-acetyltransferase AlgF n=1 Tax=Amylibacter sp. SFDW26 TaxID=2652722 RepID=UPI001262A951|nr:alginate O-acetyltransferase AlgF [Amylibacter sp. SFDW26]KAB7610143.1 hypothetical protein F9L33_14710 [Amylibacter sp. SFDW26]
MKNIMITICCVLTLVTPFKALANDEALYAAAPPSDASFVRFIGFDADEAVQFAGKAFRMRADEAGAYVPVSSSRLDNVPMGSFYSLLKKADSSVVVIQEEAPGDPAKVTLTLLNGSDQPLTLGVADGSMNVISNIATSSSGQRAVNPIAIELGVFNAKDKSLMAKFDVALRRGQNVTFFADASGVRMIEDRFGANAE